MSLVSLIYKLSHKLSLMVRSYLEVHNFGRCRGVQFGMYSFPPWMVGRYDYSMASDV
jgi:hypothetical protein